MAALDDPRETWDARYRADGYIFGTDPNAFLVSQGNYLGAGTRVLAVADGEGRNGVWMAQRGCKVRSLDISPVAIEKAMLLAADRNVEIDFEIADLMQWEWPEGAYDAVVCIFIQFASPELRKNLFEGFWKTLRPGGVLILEGYGIEQLRFTSGGPKEAGNLYTTSMLREAFSRWEIVLLREYEAALDEGPKHRGMAALVDLVARKPD